MPVSVQEGSQHGDNIPSVHLLRLADSKFSARFVPVEEWRGTTLCNEDGNFSCPFEKLLRHALLRGESIPSSTVRQLTVTFEAGKLGVQSQHGVTVRSDLSHGQLGSSAINAMRLGMRGDEADKFQAVAKWRGGRGVRSSELQSMRSLNFNYLSHAHLKHLSVTRPFPCRMMELLLKIARLIHDSLLLPQQSP